MPEKKSASEQIERKLRHALFVEFFKNDPDDVTSSMRKAFISLLSRISPDSYECHDIVILSNILTDLETMASECRM
jgi:hypothetical protein